MNTGSDATRVSVVKVETVWEVWPEDVGKWNAVLKLSDQLKQYGGFVERGKAREYNERAQELYDALCSADGDLLGYVGFQKFWLAVDRWTDTVPLNGRVSEWDSIELVFW